MAELAAELDLALGVVRVLLGDLARRGLVSLYEPPPRPSIPRRRHPQGGGQWTPCALTTVATARASRSR